MLPVGLPGARRRPAGAIPGAYDRRVRKAREPLGHRAKSYFGGPEAPATRPGEHTFRATATSKAGAPLKLAGAARKPKELKKALQPFLEPHSGNQQQQNTCQNARSHDGPGKRIDLRY